MEFMLIKSKKSNPPVVKGEVDAGFNFSDMVSTGKTPITVAGASRSVLSGAMTNPVYTGALSTGTTGRAITPVTPFKVGTGDFTLEWCFYGQGTGSSTARLFVLSGNQISFLTGSYGLRLGITHPTYGYLTFPLIRSQVINGWHHLALVRKDGLLRCFLDGTELGGAFGTGVDFQLGGREYLADWNSWSTITINDNSYSYPMLLAEIAFYQSALYTTDFTPTFPLAK